MRRILTEMGLQASLEEYVAERNSGMRAIVPTEVVERAEGSGAGEGVETRGQRSERIDTPGETGGRERKAGKRQSNGQIMSM